MLMKRKHHRKGFTLLEIMVVTSIIGMLASLAVPLWTRSIASTYLNMCLHNQRKIYEAVAQYELETGRTLDTIASNGTAVRDVLVNNGYFAKQIYFECPASRVQDYDDYNLTYNGQTLSGTVCLVDPTTHVQQ